MQPCKARMLELVQMVQDMTCSDAETVAVIASLINSGRVQLSGTFTGTRQVVVRT